MSKYLIDRPIFAWVITIIIMPPTIRITATYPGADASTLQDSVTQIVEQNMNGIDHLMYMASDTATITLTFESGADLDIARSKVQVQNKLQLAMPLLPQKVQQQGGTGAEIQLKVNPDGSQVRLKDVATIALGDRGRDRKTAQLRRGNTFGAFYLCRRGMKRHRHNYGRRNAGIYAYL